MRQSACTVGCDFWPFSFGYSGSGTIEISLPAPADEVRRGTWAERRDPWGKARRNQEATTSPVFLSCLNSTVGRMTELAGLEPNWNSYGADPISADALKSASDLLFSVQQEFYEDALDGIVPIEVAPLDDGGIQMSWRGPGREIEVEIGPGREYGFLLVEGRGDGRRFTEGGTEERVVVLDLIRLVIAS